MTTIDMIVLALYPPVVFFAAWAVWCFGANVLLPAYRMGSLSVRDHALPIALVLVATADLVENLFYGYARLDPNGYAKITGVLSAVGPMKTLILFGLIFAVAGYRKAVNGTADLGRLIAWAVGLWLLTFVVLALR